MKKKERLIMRGLLALHDSTLSIGHRQPKGGPGAPRTGKLENDSPHESFRLNATRKITFP